jgi:hypothetical protein
MAAGGWAASFNDWLNAAPLLIAQAARRALTNDGNLNSGLPPFNSLSTTITSRTPSFSYVVQSHP